jgi:hypothetical protein
VNDVPRRLVALTFDYETWQPIPPRKHIDWDADVFAPARRLIDGDLPVTLFAEMGEYFWLDANDPPIARRMEEQWRDAVRRRHDVQLHLHPAWLPECGATHTEGRWHWEERYAKADDYPGDLDALIRRCVDRLHDVLRPVDPEYRVTCFRAGAYQAQPFRRLSTALVRAGIECDSSVYAGGVSKERGYDYSFAYSDGQPYFASPYDPQLRAAAVETELVELPIAVVGGRRLMLDGAEAGVLASKAHRALTSSGCAVAIGHTKGDLRADDVLHEARRLTADGCELLTLSRLATIARAELLTDAGGGAAPAAPRPRLQQWIPLDRERVLSLDDGSTTIEQTYPWMRVTAAGDDGSFDCVYAEHAFENAADVDAALRAAYGALRSGGALVAAVDRAVRGDLVSRLDAVGFVDVTADVGERGQVMFVRAWKRSAEATELTRAREAMAWLYDRIDPRESTSSKDAVAVIAGGVALCAGYAFAMQGLLRREGLEADVVQMKAAGHPRGRGDTKTDTHEVVQARLDGRWVILDPMACTVIPHPLMEILEHPALATGRTETDARHAERGYALYDTGFWYSRVTRFRVRRSALTPWRRNPHRAPVD